MMVEQFSIECRTTKTKVISLTQSTPLSNQNLKQLLEARENLREQVTIGFGFTCDCLRKWRESVFKPITKRSNAKPK